MEKIEYPCPCGGKVKWKKEKVIQQGIDCGILDVEICNKCKSKYLPEESMIIVENKLKENGLWGMKRKEIKFWKTGNSIVTRLAYASRCSYILYISETREEECEARSHDRVSFYFYTIK